MAISLKAARVNAGLTQLQVATSLQISKGTVVSYELGRSVPDVDTAQKLAAMYGMGMDDIIWPTKPAKE